MYVIFIIQIQTFIQMEKKLLLSFSVIISSYLRKMLPLYEFQGELIEISSRMWIIYHEYCMNFFFVGFQNNQQYKNMN